MHAQNGVCIVLYVYCCMYTWFEREKESEKEWEKRDTYVSLSLIRLFLGERVRETNDAYIERERARKRRI